MRTAVRRSMQVVALSGVATSAMVVAHCTGYQVGSWLPADAHAHVTSWARAHHAHEAAGRPDHLFQVAPDVHAEHAHLLPLASGAFLVGVLGCLGVLVAWRRRTAAPVPSARALLGAQLLAFVALEASERLALGVGLAATLTDRRVVLALLAQPVLALVVHRFLRRTAEALGEWVAPRSVRPTTSGAGLAWTPLLSTVHPQPVRETARRPRGPPRKRFAPI